MVLGEAYMRDILRPPPADPSALPPNPPHPFQRSFPFYLRHRFLKYHWPLVFGYAASIYVFMSIDSARNKGNKEAYDAAIAEGRAPCEYCYAAVQLLLWGCAHQSCSDAACRDSSCDNKAIQPCVIPSHPLCKAAAAACVPVCKAAA
jgi:hypothetical protein